MPRNRNLVEQPLRQLDVPDPHVQEMWEGVVRNRIKADAEGRLATFSCEEVMAKYRNQ
ncbi:MAG: hypothetical protein HYZ00_04400 [Candidatus Hydrogenedentes bacterium]|nr:hypothetical protein [Candidatus Hydrogenedentota bacterium]